MTANIGDYFEKMITDLIASGRFQNQSEVIRAGLRLLQDAEYGPDEDLERELVRRLDRPSRPMPKDFFRNVKKRARQRAKVENIKRAA